MENKTAIQFLELAEQTALLQDAEILWLTPGSNVTTASITKEVAATNVTANVETEFLMPLKNVITQTSTATQQPTLVAETADSLDVETEFLTAENLATMVLVME
jgi:hypothetical protein